MASLTERMVRAAKLDANLYEEVEADKTAMGQAVTVVILSGLAAGIGSYTAGGLAGVIGGAIAGIAGWFLWAYVTYFIGTRILPETQTSVTHGELLRTIGFSSSPGLIRVLGVAPVLYGIVFTIASVWMVVAMIIAVRQALDYRGTMRAVGVVLIGWLFYLIVFIIIAQLLASFGYMPAGYRA